MCNLNDNHKFQLLINRFLKNPNMYISDFLKECNLIQDCDIHFKHFILFTKWSKNKEENIRLNEIYRRAIITLFSKDREFLLEVINKKGKAQLSINFEPDLIDEIRGDIKLSILLYKNIKASERDKIKKLLGVKVLNTKQFKYLYGDKL